MRKCINLPKGFRALFISALMLLVSNVMLAQFISYPTPAAPITRGLDSTLLTVQISFAACSDVNVTINLGATNSPGVIEYIPGSINKLSGVGTITESNISDLRNPVFTVGNTTLGQTLVFTIRRRAFCGNAAATKDNIVVTGTGTGCNFSETNANINTYTLLSPAFTINPPASLVNAEVGSTYNRTMSIVNGGNGCADTIGFWIKYPAASMVLNSLTIGGTPVTPLFTNGDSSYYQLTGSLLGSGNILCNGESITLVENVTILRCNVVTTYGVAGFDFSGTRCQSRTSVSGMSMSNATPTISVTASVPLTIPCFVDAPRTVTYTVKNTGGGPATSIVINTGAHFNNLTTVDVYGYIDTASVQISIAGQSAFHPDPSYFTSFTYNGTTQNNTLACNTGRINNMRLSLPASVILSAGDSIVVTYNIIYCPSVNSCTDAYLSSAQGTQVSYQNACGNTTYSSGNYVGSSSYPYNLPALSTFEFPAQVRAGDCYEVTLSSPALPTSNISARGYIEYSLTIPPGVTFSSATLIGAIASPQAGYPQVVGNTVVTRYAVSTGGNPVKFVFCTPTTLCNSFVLDAVLRTSPDSTCGATNSVRRCANSPINFVCTSPCAAGGTVPVYWNYARKNFGQPDNNYNKMPDGSGAINPAVVYDDRYRPGDTLHSEYRSFLVAQTAPASITEWPHINSNWNFTKHIWEPAGTATVTVIRSGVPTVVPGVPIAMVTYGKSYTADFSQGPAALTALAPFQVNDSIIINADFVLKDSLLSSGTSEHMTAVDDGTRGKAFSDAPDIVIMENDVYASVIAAPDAANRFTCFVPQYNANVLHLFHQSLLYGNNLIGCGAARHELRGFTRKLSGYTSNYFPGEYRPEFIPDSLMLLFPAGMTVIPGSQYVAGIYRNTPPTAPLVTAAEILPYVTITGNAVSGTTVIFNVKDALTANPSWHIQSEGTTYNFGMDARGGCATPSAFSIVGRQQGHLFNWPSAGINASFNDSARTQVNSSYSVLNKPNVNLSSSDATVTPSSDTASWSLLLQNSSAQQAPFNFIRISPNASFTDVVVKLGNVVIAPNGDGLYELGSINAGSTGTVSVTANTNSCALDSMKIESGWDCAAYLTGNDLAAYSCWKTLWIKADPLPSQIQLTVDRQPATPTVDLCVNDTMIFKMNSALANYSDNPEFRVNIPVGLSIANAEIEYPEGSGNWETIVPDIQDGINVYKIEDHSLVPETGLPGTVSNPGTANRAAKLRLTYTTSCDFVSGSKVSVQQRAERPCGSPISNDLGFNGVVRANPINISGAVSPGIVGFNLSLNPAVIGCGTSSISGSITPSGQATTTADTIMVTLPAGIVYAGNFVSADGIVVASGSPEAGPGGTQLLKLKVPDGISSGNSASYSFDIAAAFVNFGCGKLNVSSHLERGNNPLFCGGTPCPGNSKIIVGSTENEIAVTKPDLVITGFEYVSGQLAEGGAAVVAVTIANNTLLQAPANTYYVEFFCGANATPFTSVLFPSEVPQGGNITENISILLPGAPSCVNGETLNVRIRPVTAANQQQCLCTESVRGMLNVLPVSLDKFTARQQGCAIQLQWHSEMELNFNKYEVEFSSNGREFKAVSVLQGRGSNSTYNYSHQPQQGRIYYRLKMVDNDGNSKYSHIIAINLSCNGKNVLIYPNPATSVLNVNLSGFASTAIGKLYNGVGQLVLTKQLVNGTNNIAVDKLSAGNYALIVTDAGGTQQVYKVQVTH